MLRDVRSLASSNREGEVSMKRFMVITAITCVLSVPAWAGEVPTGDNPPPPPAYMTGAPAPGEMPTGGYTQDTATDIMLAAVQAIIGLLSV